MGTHRSFGVALTIALLSVSALSAQTASVLSARTKAHVQKQVEEQLEDKEFAPNEVIVRYKDGTSKKEKEKVRGKVKLAGGQALGHEKNMELTEIASGKSMEDAITELMLNEDVEYAEPNFKFYPELVPDDTRFSQQWGMRNTGQKISGQSGVSGVDIDAVSAWDTETGSDSVVVAILDSGIQITHPDLDDQLWTNPGEVAGNGIDDDDNGYIDDIHGWDFHNNDASLFDSTSSDYHGTHVAGVIGAETDNNEGIAGVNHDVKLMILKVIDSQDGGYTSNIIEAVNYAASFNVRLSNNSYGGAGYSRAFEEAIQNSGMLFVAAAGNQAMDTDVTTYYPAGYNLANVMSVAAVNNQGELSSFSNYGDQTVDIAAPGQGVVSTYPGDAYSYMNGTSMATPYVVGVAGLLLANNPLLSTTDMRELLMTTVTPLSSLNGKTVSEGIVNAHDALEGVATVTWSVNETEYLSRDVGSIVVDTTASQGRAVSATIRYDNPGYIQRGPGIELDAGNYTASFVMKTRRNKVQTPVANVEIVDENTDTVIKSLEIRGKDFVRANAYQTFTIDFESTGSESFEYRIEFTDVADLIVDYVRIDERTVDTLQAETLSSAVGTRISDKDAENGAAIKATVRSDAEGNLVASTGTTFPAGDYTAVFRMKAGKSKIKTAIATIAVESSDESQSVSQALLPTAFPKGKGFYNFALPFSSTGDETFEFTVYAWDTADVIVDKITITPNEVLQTLEAEDMDHDIGSSSVDGENGSWHGSVEQDSRGYLQQGPDGLTQEAGSYTATFRLKIAAGLRSKSAATIDVYDVGTSKVLGSIRIKSSLVTDPNEFQDYAINYTRTIAGITDFRVYFEDNYDVTADNVQVITQASL